MKKVFVLLSFCPDVWKLFNKNDKSKTMAVLGLSKPLVSFMESGTFKF